MPPLRSPQPPARARTGYRLGRLDHQAHLFRERTLTSVTANTRLDGEELLRLAAAIGIRARVTTYPFPDADTVLDDLATGALTGAAVLPGIGATA